MPVDFFSAHHTQSNLEEFGLYDDPNPAKNPSYILETDKPKWIGIVKNSNKITADFYGLDHSLKIPLTPPSGNHIESLCDGMLHFKKNLLFVELKERESKGWIGKATDQLINAIRLFALNHNINDYDQVGGRVCNSLKPRLNTNTFHSREKFKVETQKLKFKGGTPIDFIVQQEIEIQ